MGRCCLQRTNKKLNLLERAAACFQDRRKPWLAKHQVEEMIAQRVYGLALGYEDLSDHDQLRQDPLLALVSGKKQVGEEALAGKSTLNRLELSTAEPSRYKKVHCQREPRPAFYALPGRRRQAPPTGSVGRAMGPWELGRNKGRKNRRTGDQTVV